MVKPGDSSSSSNDQQQLGRETPPQINDCAVGEDAPMQGTDQKICPTMAQQTGGNNGGNNVRAEGGTDAVIVVGGPLEGPNRKRRGRNHDPPSGVTHCVVCGRHFNSPRALHGHLRSHPELPWRGVLPPPTRTGTSRIGPLAQGVMWRMTPAVIGAGGVDGTKGDEPAPSVAKDSTSSPARRLGIDLNGQPQEKGPKSPRFDLNMPAPEDTDYSEGSTDAVNVVGGPLEGPNRKWRGRNDDPPSGVTDCVVCGRHFNSPKALHGHLRSHPERPWRGVLPPMTGTGTSRIGPRAQGVMSRMTPAVIGAGGVDGTKGDEPAPSAAKDSTSSPARGLGIDLNQPQEKDPKSPRFDLNMHAPEDDDEYSYTDSS